MNIKEVYNTLTNKVLTLSDFNDILSLKNQCKKEMNQEYLYLSDILIIDIYINEGLFDDALNIANKAINQIDNVVFQKIYISLLERFIYIFIQKKNFKSAYRYAFMKRNYIDLDNIDEVNRWYLEMAYIYAELNQKDKALLNLKAIMNNYPNDSLKALTLSNMTKLYIDESQLEEAKKTLNDCISLVYKLGDEEGILYCNYLNAKLYILEKNYKHAKHSFQDVFKNIHVITDDYLNIANEYVSLLIEMDLYDEAHRICVRYLKDIEKSNDLEIKKNFYTNYLKIHILKNKNIREDARQLLNAIEILQKQIDKNDDAIINESNEDDKKIEIEDQLSKLIQKIEKTMNITLISLESDSIRNALMNYSKQLEQHIVFDEATYVIFPIDAFDAVTEVNDNYNKVFTFNYKKERLYERETTYNNLKGSIVEMIISQNHEIMIDFSDSYLEVKDVISNYSYTESGFKSLIAIPLFNKNELYGCAIYLSKTNELINNDVMTNLKIATKLLEPKLVNIYFEENIRTLKTINNNLVNHVTKGTFYYNVDSNMFTLSNNLLKFFNIESRKLSLKDYEDFIKNEDLIIRNKIDTNIENVEEYNCEYRVIINKKEYLINELAYPYITRDGVVKFYFGVITVIKDAIEVENQIYKKFNEDDFTIAFHGILDKSKDLDYKCNFIKFRVNNINEYAAFIQMKIHDYVYSKVQKEISINSFYLKDNDVISIVEGNDPKLERDIKSLLNNFDKGLIDNDKQINFEVRASLVRFPSDTYNIKEIMEFCNISLTMTDRFQQFNDRIRRLYIKKKSITACVNEHIVKKNIELLYNPLKQNSENSGYFIKYNINGLDTNESIKNYLDDSLFVGLEKLVFNTLLCKMQSLKSKVYISLNLKTLDYLLKEDYFKKENLDKYRSIVICIDDYNNINLDINKVIKSLENFEFGIILNFDSFNSINIDTFINNKFIKGIYTNTDLLSKYIYLDIFKVLNYEIISNKISLDYYNFKLIDNEILKF